MDIDEHEVPAEHAAVGETPLSAEVTSELTAAEMEDEETVTRIMVKRTRLGLNMEYQQGANHRKYLEHTTKCEPARGSQPAEASRTAKPLVQTFAPNKRP